MQTQPLSGLPRRVGREGFFLLPVPVPPISWLLPSESQPSLCLGVRASCSDPGEHARLAASCPTAARLPPGPRVGCRSPRVLPADFPGPQGGGPYRDAPRHVPHAQREPTEAAHDEGVGAPHPSPWPPHPEFVGAERAGLTDPLLCFCPQSQGHEEQAGHLQAAERVPWGPASRQGRQSDEVIQVGPPWHPGTP